VCCPGGFGEKGCERERFDGAKIGRDWSEFVRHSTDSATPLDWG